MFTVYFRDKNRKPIVLGYVNQVRENDDYITCYIGSGFNLGGSRDFYKYDVKNIVSENGYVIWANDELNDLYITRDKIEFMKILINENCSNDKLLEVCDDILEGMNND